MSQIIHVPQGYSAHLHTGTLAYDINGLYTDDFTTCNILVCIAKEKVKLIHADIDVARGSYITEEISSMTNLQKLMIIYRERIGEPVKIRVYNAIRGLPSLKVEEYQLKKELYGVLVTCVPGATDNLEVKLDYLSVLQCPNNLLHHPDEQKLLAVQKMRQIIGFKGRKESNKQSQRKFYIFDGLAWEPLTENELKISTQNQIIVEEMKFFDKQDPFVIIAGKLMGILDEISKAGFSMHDNPKDFGADVAFYLEGYLNDFNYPLLLKCNLKDMLDQYLPGTQEDIKLKMTILELVKQTHDIADELKTILEKYTADSPATHFKEEVLNECKEFLKHHERRKKYEDMAETKKEWLEKSKNIGESGLRVFNSGRYQEASTYYTESLKLLTYAVDKCNPSLATAYYNLGRILQKMNEHKQALSFLKTALILQEHYTIPTPSVQTIEKTRGALSECHAAVGTVSTEITNKHRTRVEF